MVTTMYDSHVFFKNWIDLGAEDNEIREAPKRRLTAVLAYGRIFAENIDLMQLAYHSWPVAWKILVSNIWLRCLYDSVHIAVDIKNLVCIWHEYDIDDEQDFFLYGKRQRHRGGQEMAPLPLNVEQMRIFFHSIKTICCENPQYQL